MEKLFKVCVKMYFMLPVFLFLFLLPGCHQRNASAKSSKGDSIEQNKAQAEEAKLKQYGLGSPVIALVSRAKKSHSNISSNDFHMIIHSIQSQTLTPKEAEAEMYIMLAAPNLDKQQKQEARSLSQHIVSSNYKDDSDARVKGAALMVIGKMDKKKAIPYLSTFLHDSQDNVITGASVGISLAKR